MVLLIHCDSRFNRARTIVVRNKNTVAVLTDRILDCLSCCYQKGTSFLETVRTCKVDKSNWNPKNLPIG